MSDRPLAIPVADTPLDDLRGVFGKRLLSLVVYGERGAGGHGSAEALTAGAGADAGGELTRTLAIVESLDALDLRACAGLTRTWAKRGLAVPLMMTVAELSRSLDAFPLELNEILTHHVVVDGPSPFAGLSIRAEDLRRACEVQARSHLLHLREGYLQAGGQPRPLAQLVSLSLRPFRVLLANVAQLAGADPGAPAALARSLEEHAGLPAALVTQVLALASSGAASAPDAEAIFPAYLDLVERLVRHVDGWRG
jgi:hypothetical protein